MFNLALQMFFIASLIWTKHMGAASEDLRSPIPVETEFLPAQYFPELGSKRVKVNYGLHEVPSMHEDGGMLDLFDQVPLPCEDCLVTWMQAGLEYANGSRADADTGMWLHHTVFSILNKPNSVCPNDKPGDWFFASGNERSEINLCESGRSRSGYYIEMHDKMTMLTDLMNMRHYKQSVTLTVTWEYIPLPPKSHKPNGFTYLTPYWFDIGGCGNSELPAEPDAHFHYSMPPVKAVFAGEVKMMVGHLHDGGVRLDVVRDNEIVCSMDAEYSIYGVDEHVSGISNCSNVGTVKPGQVWSITAHYDTIKHKPMMGHDGKLEPIMGIVLAYVAEQDQNMKDGGKSNHHCHHHVLLVMATFLIVINIMFGFSYLWLKRRGETVMDYIPQKLQRLGRTSFGRFKRRIELRGDRPSASLLDHESLPAYQDED